MAVTTAGMIAVVRDDTTAGMIVDTGDTTAAITGDMIGATTADVPIRIPRPDTSAVGAEHIANTFASRAFRMAGQKRM